MTRDLRTLIYLLKHEECSRTLGPRAWAGIQQAQLGSSSRSSLVPGYEATVEVDVIGEQQLKRMQSGSSSRSGHDREQQLKWMQAASSRRNQRAAAEAEGEQQLKWMPQSGPGAAAEADASGEQQLKRTESGSSSACSLHRELSGAGLRTVGERGGSS